MTSSSSSSKASSSASAQAEAATRPMKKSSADESAPVSLEDLVRDILQQVGVLQQVEQDSSFPTNDVYERMEQWLGFSSSSTSTTTSMLMDDSIITVEDCAPLSSSVYQTTAALCCHAWNPPVDTVAPNTNVLIEELHRLQEDDSSSSISEEELVQRLSLDCIPAVRVTKWIRHWMECNVQGNNNAAATSSSNSSSSVESSKSFSHYLVRGQQPNQIPDYAPALFQALFHHMMQLPHYQSQILLFNQAFQRGDVLQQHNNKNKNKNKQHTLPKSSSTTTTTALQDPTQRLHHYQLAQQFAQTLNDQWTLHVSRMEYVVGEWYRVSPSSLRRLARAGLGRLWMKFSTEHSSGNTVGGGAPSTVSLKGENTSASGLDVSLRILYRILLGRRRRRRRRTQTQKDHDDDDDDTNTSNNDNNNNDSDAPEEDDEEEEDVESIQRVLQPLLFQQLLPLHQPHAMVLWRDQTALLELYHEPLVQCTAYVLKRVPMWIPTVCQALLVQTGGSIWPMGGNTPKQVLLLHEVDTYLGILGTVEKEREKQQRQEKGTKKEEHEMTCPDNNMILDEATFGSILSTLAHCMASEHSRLAERALTMFRNSYFKQLVHDTYHESSLTVLLPALIRSKATDTATTNAIPWNPTVRKMTFHVLKNLQNANPATFSQVANRLFSGNHHHVSLHPTEETTTDPQQQQAPKKSSLLQTKPQQPTSPSSVPAFNQPFSLQAGMGDWRPPPSARTRTPGGSTGRHTNMPPPSARPPKNNKQNPPLGVTGVAPWAQQQSSSFSSDSRSSSSKNPPSTVTGIAPWAHQQQQQHPRSGGGVNKNNPPLTVTDVAPWANQRPPTSTTTGSKFPPIPAAGGLHKRPGAGPPLPATHSRKQSPRPPPHPTSAALSEEIPTVEEEAEEDEEQEEVKDNGVNHTTKASSSDGQAHVPSSTSDTLSTVDPDKDPGLAKVLHYMEQCKPPGMDEDEDEHASSSWAKAQMAETPTLLPELKFHDLVFGHELGHGAFGVVKYARLIDRTKTRSHWPEYAVKIIATEKMKELGYEFSVAREIACLHLISHPNVARLVSSFRFQQGAYLVLEYASGGDLHQLLQQHGSLDVPSTQFVMGEVVAALNSLHEDLSFVYGDLKPENVVLTETGHVKLTDFGGCRPFTERAREMLKAHMGQSGKSLLETLREGDPRKIQQQQREKESRGKGSDSVANEHTEDEDTSGWMSEDDSSKHHVNSAINDDTMQVTSADEDNHKEDFRVEGTTAYLPPEVVLGSIPTPAADCWALGCVLYQCLSGRPPILEADDARTRSKIVTFEHTADEYSGGALSSHDPLFGSEQAHATEIPEVAKSLIRSLLERVPTKRPSMQSVAQHDFFEGQDVLSLYQKAAYPLDVGDVAPGPPDAQWSRRQFSSIWAPQPHAYDISGAAAGTGQSSNLNGSSFAPIPEGDEASAPFSASNFYKSGNLPKQNATTSRNDTVGQHLSQIEEDDVSMASYNSENQQMSEQ